MPAFARRPCVFHCLLALLLSTCATTCPAQKTDIVISSNGDRTTGDIKELYRGLLRLSTDHMGTIYIQWETVASVESSKRYSVGTRQGQRAFGTISTSPDGEKLVIRYQDSKVAIAKADVVTLSRVKEGLWSRLEGSIGLGVSAKQAQNEVILNFTLDARYRTRDQLYALTVNSDYSDSSNALRTERHVLEFLHSAYLVDRWWSLSWAEFQQNTAMALKLRSLVAAGASYEFIRNHRNQLATAIGLTANRETYFIDTPNRLSGELFLNLSYDYFKLRTPRADVATSLNIYPSLTEQGRVRTALNSTVSWEMIKDFRLAISLYFSSDNQAPENQEPSANQPDQAASTDWGLVTSIEWKY